MTEEKTMTFKQEGEPAFQPDENTENENSAASSTDQTTNDQTQSQEGEQNSGANKDDDGKKDKGFADDPRWKEREDDWKKRFNDQEERHTSELQKIREEFEQKFAPKQKELQSEEIPAWFGGDQDQWNAYRQHENEVIKQAEESAFNRINSAKTEEQKKIDEATRYMEKSISDIESDKELNPSGEKIDRNKLLKFVLDNELVDTKGNWNYRMGFITMKALGDKAKNTNLDEKKKIAAATTGDGKAETKPQPFMTSDDFKKPGARPW